MREITSNHIGRHINCRPEPQELVDHNILDGERVCLCLCVCLRLCLFLCLCLYLYLCLCLCLYLGLCAYMCYTRSRMYTVIYVHGHTCV